MKFKRYCHSGRVETRPGFAYRLRRGEHCLVATFLLICIFVLCGVRHAYAITTESPFSPLVAKAHQENHYIHVLDIGDEALLARIHLIRSAQETIDCADVLAFELREALDALGTVTGAVTTEDLLGQVFAKFCIGK